ncbi:uncharacterized protein LOC134825408 [Bolinopsis microptera]|uniref:uncharacterized protein LOC134825408 n=1 Tax=Bolinopsis microptera TaxID=2820187 RepID=UPI003079E382
MSNMSQFTNCTNFAADNMSNMSQFTNCTNFAADNMSNMSQFTSCTNFAADNMSNMSQFTNCTNFAADNMSNMSQFTSCTNFAADNMSNMSQFTNCTNFAADNMSNMSQFINCTNFAADIMSNMSQFTNCTNFAADNMSNMSQFTNCTNFAADNMSNMSQFINCTNFAADNMSNMSQFTNCTNFAADNMSNMSQFINCTNFAADIMSNMSQFTNCTNFAADNMSNMSQFINCTNFAADIMSNMSQFTNCTNFAADNMSNMSQFTNCTNFAADNMSNMSQFTNCTNFAADIMSNMSQFTTSVSLLSSVPHEDHADFYTGTERYVMMSFLILCIIFTLAGNSVMLWSIVFVPSLQTVNNVFLASLCCANLLNGLFTMPFIAHSLTSNQSDVTVLPLKKASMCTISGFVDNGAMVGFMWTLTLLSIDRFVLIRYPIWYKLKQNKNRAALLLLLTWTFSCGLVTPPIFHVGKYRYSKWTFSCGIDPIDKVQLALDNVYNPTFCYFLGFCCVNSVLPIPIVLISNLHILGVLLKTPRRIRKEHLARRYRKSAKLMMVLTAYLMLSLSPVFIGSYLLIVNVIRPNTIPMESFPSMRLILTSHMLFLGNGAVTPIFFGLFNTSIRNKSTVVIQRQGTSLISSISRKLQKKGFWTNVSHSSFSSSLRKMFQDSASAKVSVQKEEDQTRLVVPRQSSNTTQNGTQQTVITDIGCSPFDSPNQRFVFPAPSSSEGLEGELLRVWDEEYLKVSNGVESEV